MKVNKNLFTSARLRTRKNISLFIVIDSDKGMIFFVIYFQPVHLLENISKKKLTRNKLTFTYHVNQCFIPMLFTM